MLSAKGIMTFITSNKWIRSEYGRKLRKLFLENEIVLLIDFGRNRLFGATVDSNIISIKKVVQKIQPSLYYFDENTEGSSLMEMLKYGEVKNVHLSEEAWLLKAGENDKMKSKIESHGIPLKDFGVNIFRGILTGFNKAYHIDEIEIERLINLDGKNSSIIKPLMCGGDTEKFFCKPPQLWIINIHNGIKGGDIKPIDINNYPIIKRRLDTFYDVLSNRNDKGSTPYNLRNCAYLDLLVQPKIIWGEISDRSKFCLDVKGVFYPEATTFMLSGEHLPYLLAFLNCNVSEYLFSLIGTTTGVGTVRWKKYKILELPVPMQLPKNQYDAIVSLCNKVINAHDVAMESTLYIDKLNELISNVYGLSNEEVNYIDSHLRK